jgi:hypothetical protein
VAFLRKNGLNGDGEIRCGWYGKPKASSMFASPAFPCQAHGFPTGKPLPFLLVEILKNNADRHDSLQLDNFEV